MIRVNGKRPITAGELAYRNTIEGIIRHIAEREGTTVEEVIKRMEENATPFQRRIMKELEEENGR